MRTEMLVQCIIFHIHIVLMSLHGAKVSILAHNLHVFVSEHAQMYCEYAIHPIFRLLLHLIISIIKCL